MIKFALLLLMVGCTSLFYYPDRFLYVQPEKYKFTYREVVFHPTDNTELIGWFFPAQSAKPKGTIILFHGNAQNMSAHFLGLSWIMERGFNLFVFDYRGYGISDGTPTPDGVYLDSIAALYEGHKLWKENGEGKLIVYGQSLGGAIAMRALADFKHTQDVDLIVQDATFMSYQDIGFHKLSRSLLFPVSPLAYLVVSDKYSSEEFVKKNNRPTLVIIDKKDKVVAPKFGIEIYETLTTPHKWLWSISEGGHLQTFHNPNGLYRDRFIELIDSLSTRPNPSPK